MTSAADASSARRVTTTALLAALLAVSAAISIPFGTVPATLQVLVLVLIALVMPRSWAAFAVAAYLLVGAVGLPVFSGMRGGLAVLTGPTGGYLFGFLVGAPAGAWVRRLLGRTASAVVADSVAAVVVLAIVYAMGWAQLVLVTGMAPLAGLLAGVVPFVVPDALKATAAVLLAPLVRRAAGIENAEAAPAGSQPA
jgi:biotin transport system substrate-specific component